MHLLGSRCQRLLLPRPGRVLNQLLRASISDALSPIARVSNTFAGSRIIANEMGFTYRNAAPACCQILYTDMVAFNWPRNPVTKTHRRVNGDSTL
jgi:hypothetical protein